MQRRRMTQRARASRSNRFRNGRNLMTHHIVRLALVFGWLLLAVLPAFPGQEEKQPDTKANLPRVEKDVPYADGGDQQMIDLYLPGKRDFLTVVFTYGGGWHSGSRKS